MAKQTKKTAPSTKKKGTSKSWGKVDKAALAKLITDGDVDITDTNLANIDTIREEFFPHRDRRNFHRNFRDFAAAWDLENSLTGIRSK
jgi:hypothetical protein